MDLNMKQQFCAALVNPKQEPSVAAPPESVHADTDFKICDKTETVLVFPNDCCRVNQDDILVGMHAYVHGSRLYTIDTENEIKLLNLWYKTCLYYQPQLRDGNQDIYVLKPVYSEPTGYTNVMFKFVESGTFNGFLTELHKNGYQQLNVQNDDKSQVQMNIEPVQYGHSSTPCSYSIRHRDYNVTAFGVDDRRIFTNERDINLRPRIQYYNHGPKMYMTKFHEGLIMLRLINVSDSLKPLSRMNLELASSDPHQFAVFLHRLKQFGYCKSPSSIRKWDVI